MATTPWTSFGTADLSPQMTEATSGLATQLAARERRRLDEANRESLYEYGEGKRNLALGEEDLRKAKKSAVVGDIASLGTAGLMMVPGVGGALSGLFGKAGGAMVQGALPGIVGNVAGSPTAGVTGLTNLASGIRERMEFEQEKRDAAKARQPYSGTGAAPMTGPDAESYFYSNLYPYGGGY